MKKIIIGLAALSVCLVGSISGVIVHSMHGFSWTRMMLSLLSAVIINAPALLWWNKVFTKKLK